MDNTSKTKIVSPSTDDTSYIKLAKQVKAKSVFNEWCVNDTLDSFAFEEASTSFKSEQLLAKGHHKPLILVASPTTKSKSEQLLFTALLDSGGSESLLTTNIATKMGLKSSKSTPTRWVTSAGDITTTSVLKSELTFPELNHNKVIEWSFHMTPSLGAYDMILGRDFMQAYGIDIRFSNATIEWDSKVIPFSDADDVLRMLRSSDPQSDCRWRRPRTQSRYIYPPGHPIREALNRERATWERKKMLLWLQNEYQRSFNRTIERHTSNNCKLHTVEGVHLHTNTANSHEHSASIEMEINRLQRLGVLQRSTMPQRSVSASSLRPNNPERGHMRSIEDGTIGSPTRHSFEFETPPFEFINRGLMLTTFTMDTAEGFRRLVARRQGRCKTRGRTRHVQ